MAVYPRSRNIGPPLPGVPGARGRRPTVSSAALVPIDPALPRRRFRASEDSEWYQFLRGEESWRLPGQRVDRHNNYYLLPSEMIHFLYLGGYVDRNESIDLGSLELFFDTVIQTLGTVDVERTMPQNVRIYERTRFMANEIRRLFRANIMDIDPRDNLPRRSIFPWVSRGRQVFHIPIADVRDLPVYLSIFILYRICSFAMRANGNQQVLFSVFLEDEGSVDEDMGMDQFRFVANYFNNNRPVVFNNAHITMHGFQSIYLAILKHIAALLPGNIGRALGFQGICDPSDIMSWNGSEISGTRIRLFNYLGDSICLRLFFMDVATQRIGGKWTPQVEKLLEESVGNAVLSVRNRSDNKCLIYCVVLGLITKVMGAGRIFGTVGSSTFMVEDYEVFAKAQFYFSNMANLGDPCVRLLQKLSMYLVAPRHSETGVLAPSPSEVDSESDVELDDVDLESEESESEDEYPGTLGSFLDLECEEEVEEFTRRWNIRRSQRPALSAGSSTSSLNQFLSSSSSSGSGSPSPDPLQRFIQDLDTKVGTMTDILKFKEEFSEIEEMLIPKDSGVFVGIDVYGLDFNVNVHVYPLYFSERRGQKYKQIELLCVTPKNGGCSHYCLIVNSEELFKRSGGKQFFSCSKCGQSFYFRGLLQQHKCKFAGLIDGKVLPSDVGVNSSSKESGYHYSNAYADESCGDMVIGSCSKCRLWFTDEFRFDYHKQHCLMDGISGYRHVQLVEYNPTTQPMLRGVTIDDKNEEKHVLSRHMMYADFECSIDGETGKHTFMSYGIYDWEVDIYECGYTLDEFFDFILEQAWLIQSKDEIYVFFHNAMGYDANFILKHVLSHPSVFGDWGIKVIMKSTNKLQKLVFYTTRKNPDTGKSEKRNIHICDSFLFLTMSLERIVASVRKNDNVEENKKNFSKFFHIMYQRYGTILPESREDADKVIDHILRKNIFPYKFFTDSSKLDTGVEEFKAIFDPRDPENLKYFSERVTIKDLEKQYEDTASMLDIFGCETARDYHDLYLCCDVMQLADLFNNAMEILWESHKIHLTKYIGMPSASWAAFLRHDPMMEIPLYTDTFYAEFFKSMIRGGITSAATRYAKADTNHSIIYVDVNGLYPYVMQSYAFPCGGFKFEAIKWEEDEAKARLPGLFREFAAAGNKGMCFCVDLHIPDYVKKETDMYPFAPEHRKIFHEFYEDYEDKKLTPFLQRWSDANEHVGMKEFNGLVCTLYDKEKYNVHWRLLRFYMEHGVIVKKVWFAVSFDEGFYLRGYVKKNIDIRNTRKDELGKTVYKLLGNSIYGKTFESPFKRNTYMIVREKNKLQGMLEQGNLASILPIDDLGWIVRMDGEDIVLDKPTFIGACVCEFAKLHMYELLYDKMCTIFPHDSRTGEQGCKMLYTDTDSFILQVLHPYELIAAEETKFIESADGTQVIRPQDLFKYIKSKDPTLLGGIGGQIKSETGEEDFIVEYIGLRSKVYTYKTLKGKIDKRAKGTTHDAQETQLTWDVYKEALTGLVNVQTHNAQFERLKFGIRSIDRVKISLSVNDGKRQILEDGINTHAFGYDL